MTLELVNHPKASQALKSLSLARTEFESLEKVDWDLLARVRGSSTRPICPGPC